MKNKLNKVIAATCVCIGMSVNCFASEMYVISDNSRANASESQPVNKYDEKNNTVTVNAIPDIKTGALRVSGKFSSKGVNEFTLLILKPGETPENITNENFMEKTDFIFMGQTDEDGSFSVGCLPYESWSGLEQRVIISGSETGFASFIFITSELESKIVSLILNSDSDSIDKMLSEEMLIEGNTLGAYLGIDFSDYNSLDDKETVCTQIAGRDFKSISNLGNAIVDAITAQKEYETALAADAALLKEINQATDSQMHLLIIQNSQRFQIDTEREYGYSYLKKLWDEGESDEVLNVYDALRNTKKLSRFKDAFDEAVLLASVNSAAWQSVYDIITLYEDELGIENIDDYDDLSNSQKSDILRKMASSEFKTIAAVKKKFSDLIESFSSSGKAGGGGGSSKGSGASGQMTLPVVQQDMQSDGDKNPVFTDIVSVPWATEAIEFMSNQKIINGYPDGSFKPESPVTREEFAKILVLSLGLFNKNAVCEFDDVSKDSWYYQYVASAYEAGIIKGTGESFGSANLITREDAATMIYRAALMINKELGEGKTFSDENLISDYAKDAVRNLGGGIISGDENGNFNPKDQTTRAQAVKLLYELIK